MEELIEYNYSTLTTCPANNYIIIKLRAKYIKLNYICLLNASFEYWPFWGWLKLMWTINCVLKWYWFLARGTKESGRPNLCVVGIPNGIKFHHHHQKTVYPLFVRISLAHKRQREIDLDSVGFSCYSPKGNMLSEKFCMFSFRSVWTRNAYPISV